LLRYLLVPICQIDVVSELASSATSRRSSSFERLPERFHPAL